jgi:hypothetical protein
MNLSKTQRPQFPEASNPVRPSCFVLATRIGSVALTILLACGSGDGMSSEPLAIRELSPPGIGARTPDFDLTLRGTGFGPDSRVLLGDVELVTVAQSATLLIAHVPAGTAGTTGPATLPVSVGDATARRSNLLTLTVKEALAPVLSGISSDLCLRKTGPVHVNVLGDNFTTDTTVTSDGQPVSITSRSSSSISFQISRGGQDVSSFKVTVPPPGGGEAFIDFFADFFDCD